MSFYSYKNANAEASPGAVGGNVVTDAFGIVALVALAPLIAIQIMGLLYARRTQAQTAPNILDDTVVELEEY